MYEFRRAGTDDPELFYWKEGSEESDEKNGPPKKNDLKVPLDFDLDIIALDERSAIDRISSNRLEELCTTAGTLISGLYLSKISSLLGEEIAALDAAGAILPIVMQGSYPQIFQSRVTLMHDPKSLLQTLERLALPIPYTLQSGGGELYSLIPKSGHWRDALKLMQHLYEAHVPGMLVAPDFIRSMRHPIASTRP